ncbi:TaqI-like C-terminal specificity domain-containing protein [Fervidicella metallireducens]|uniref:TaqI-like C-terminal specificity domain-containing protein n=1 Tax=Fervidicella metallireducens TaxID=655338 RepID=UPI0006863AA9|nr:TaqI-like C-terminal specificity domain-containing protein [Fervidicella metallireducens]
MGSKVFDDIVYIREKYSKFISFDSQFLDNKGWVFLDDKERSILNKIKGVELNCICESFQGIITGCDAAFIISKEEAEELNIEADIIKPWIKNKNIDSFKVKETQELIIYSDLIENEEEYKNALNYISKHREILEKRRECIRGVRKWYQLQWGRKEYIFQEKKIVYPFKASKNRFAIDEGSYFSADVYIIKLRDMFIDKISYEFLAGVLNSSIYEFYIKTMAKKLGDELYEYYPNKVMTLKIPEYIKEIEEEVLKGGEDIKERVDNILLRYFNITQDEYDVIKTWCY